MSMRIDCSSNQVVGEGLIQGIGTRLILPRTPGKDAKCKVYRIDWIESLSVEMCKVIKEGSPLMRQNQSCRRFAVVHCRLRCWLFLERRTTGQVARARPGMTCTMSTSGIGQTGVAEPKFSGPGCRGLAFRMRTSNKRRTLGSVRFPLHSGLLRRTHHSSASEPRTVKRQALLAPVEPLRRGEMGRNLSWAVPLLYSTLSMLFYGVQYTSPSIQREVHQIDFQTPGQFPPTPPWPGEPCDWAMGGWVTAYLGVY